MNIISIIFSIVSLGISMYIFFTKSYIVEKAKNLATKQDIGEITRIVEKEKANIQSEYNIKLEQLRSELKTNETIILSALSSEYNNKLERLKSELKTNETILASVLASQSKSFEVAQKEIVEALKSLWQNCLLMRKVIFHYEFYDKAMFEEELETLFTSSWTGNRKAPDAIKSVNISNIHQINDSGATLEKLRLFLGNTLWNYFAFYMRFTGRILYLYSKNSTENKFQHWKKDSALMGISKQILSVDEYQLILDMNMGTIQAVLEFVDQKILLEAKNILAGRIAAENIYNQAITLIALNKPELDSSGS